jgi:hypothetical protein
MKARDRDTVAKVVWLLLALLLLLASAVAIGVTLPNQPHASGRDRPLMLPPAPTVEPGAIDTLLAPGSIQAIDEPQFESVARAEESLRPDERVIGLVINGDARAYPIPVLSVHEIVNDVVGGEPVAVTWCPLCYTALVFSRDVDGRERPLSFGVSGKLLHNTLIMVDRQTDTLWSQLYGAAVDGPLAGTRLAFFPSLLTDWATWKTQHPGGRVLSKELTCAQFDCGTYADNPRGSYAVDAYASYYNTSDEGVVDAQIPRDAQIGAVKKRVLGVRVAGQARAYPYQVLQERPLINDNINDLPVLVWFDPATQTGTAFERRVGERVLTFRLDSAETGILVDEETGSRWRATSGTAIEGPLRGKQLPAVPATPAFEFGWTDYFPHSQTYPVER